MYNDTVSPEVSCLLDHYIKAGLLTLLPWRFDMVSQKEIRTEGLFAALNDCLYRNMGRVEHLVMIDLDELIIPYQVVINVACKCVLWSTAKIAAIFENLGTFLS